MSPPLLSIERLTVRYGRALAVSELDLQLRAGEIVAVLGANGAGKTTLLKTIIGGLQPSSGRIVMEGRDLTGVRAPQRVSCGLALVPEGRQVFVSMTVEENLLIGAVSRRRGASERGDLEQIYEQFPNLAERRHLEARVLSGGEQQMLAIGRALMARPRLVLLDEPSLGLSPMYVSRVFKLLQELNAQGLSMLIVEQNVPMVMRIASHAYVLELGSVVAQGTAAELLRSERLQEAYLGRDSPA